MSESGLTVGDLFDALPLPHATLRASDGDRERWVRGIHHDSRLVGEGDVFVVRQGKSHDGSSYIESAIARGAVCLIVEPNAVSKVPAHVPCIVVPDATLALAHAADAIYMHPSFSMEVVGITGTNGKTTTTHLLRAGIDAAHYEGACGIIGTIGHRIGKERIPSDYTTPEADELARVMFAMHQKGASFVAMEVSSIAIELSRVAAVRFRVAAFTNLTQDHLDFHGTMENYAHAKEKLFRDLGPAIACINIDDAFGAELAGRAPCPVLRTSTKSDRGADFFPREAKFSMNGLRATIATPKGDLEFASRLVGSHNLENVLLCLAILHALELDLQAAARGMAESPGVPGRLERCDEEGDGIVVLVDYAHTPDAIAHALRAVRFEGSLRVFCVFGCGGDRDPKKRAPMAAASAEGADITVVTSDNPRSENPADIVVPVVSELRARKVPELVPNDIVTARRGFTLELDRQKAIELAVCGAQSGDVVLIAGKGHEDYQIIGTEKRHFDDREVAKAALRARRNARTSDGDAHT